MNVFAIPGVYHFMTRVRTPRFALYWSINVLGVIVLVSWQAGGLAWVDALLILPLALAAWQSVYEVGYLENDLITTQRERSPTLRLEQERRQRLMRAYTPMVTTKLIIASVAIAALAAIEEARGIDLQLTAFVVCLVALRLAYWAHNSTRGRAAIATFALLQVGKYAAIPLLVAPAGSIGFLVAACVPVPMFILEYASQPRFGMLRLRAWLHPLPRSRVITFLLLTLSFTALRSWLTWPWLDTALLVSFALLVFRSVAFVVLLFLGDRLGALPRDARREYRHDR